MTGGLNYYRAMNRASPDGDGNEHSLARLAADFRETEMRVEVPTMVIWGEADPALRPGCLDGLDEYVSNLTVHRLHAVGHWVLPEAPEAVRRLIRGFLPDSNAGNVPVAFPASIELSHASTETGKNAL